MNRAFRLLIGRPPALDRVFGGEVIAAMERVRVTTDRGRTWVVREHDLDGSQGAATRAR
ncbi:MAG: hypothetical protein IPG04_40070 [Polyangiaceae bacterium]|nr:hypothetical protein [Polyangiaceae bacterium]